MYRMFTKDKNPDKVNMVVGAYRDDKGDPWILPIVQKVNIFLFSLNFL